MATLEDLAVDGEEAARIVAEAAVGAGGAVLLHVRDLVLAALPPVVLAVVGLVLVVVRIAVAAQDLGLVAVVPRALVRVAEHGVRILDLLELLRGHVEVVGILVRVPLQRLLPVALLDVRLRGLRVDTQHLVVARRRHACQRAEESSGAAGAGKRLLGEAALGPRLRLRSGCYPRR